MGIDIERIFDLIENNQICKHKQTKMKEEINVNKLIETFTDMANRGSLLTGCGVNQHDLLIQIIGTIAVVAMEDSE